MQTRLRRVSVTFNRVFGSLALMFAVSSVSLPAHAVLIFDFEFGGVSGQVFGLTEGFSQAERLVVSAGQGATSSPLEIIPGAPSTMEPNWWTIENGVITSALFQVQSHSSTLSSGAVRTTAILLDLTAPRFFFAQSTFGFATDVLINTSVGSFSASQPTMSVPEPSPISLLGAGVIAFGVLRRKRRQLIK